jgi:NMD protein affecting ribosome stability and mRNA decay
MTKSSGGNHQPRRDRLLRGKNHDPYRSNKKLPEPTVCPDCKAVYRQGRWQWLQDSQGVERSPCPACQRIRDRYPAGYLSLAGSFLEEHREEISQLARNIESREKELHPLNRIMDVETTPEGLQITTTEMQLARTIGNAVQRAYGGEIDYGYEKEASVLRVTWKR